MTEAGGSESEKGDMTTERMVGVMSSEDGRGAVSQGVQGLLEDGKGQEMDPLQEPAEHSPVDIFFSLLPVFLFTRFY